MWGSPESLREIKALVQMIEQAQQQTLPADPLKGAQIAPTPPAPRGPVTPPKITGVTPKSSGEKTFDTDKKSSSKD
jgi:hypothetical protein